MHWRARSLLLLLLLPSVAATPFLSAVVPDLPGAGPGDEGFAVAAPEPVDLTGWSVTDGEDAWTFPAGTVVGPEESWFVGDTALWTSFGEPAPAASGLGLRLGNDGDDVRLLDPDGVPVDAFSWGDAADAAVSYTSPGLVYRPGAGAGDGAASWVTPRAHRVGESHWPAAWVTVGAVQPYVCPDHCLAVWSDLLAGATARAALHVYDLRSPWLADALVDAAGRVPLSVLVQERPVGMGADDERDRDDALRRIEAAGGEAVLATRGRYAYHHLKVLVVDDAVAVQSDNGVPSSFPRDPTWGSRGWGVVVHDAALADEVWSLLAGDRAAWDVEPFEQAGGEAALRLPARSGDHRPLDLGTAYADVRLRLVVTPEHTADPATDPVLAAVRGAEHSVWTQQLDLRLDAGNDLGWGADDGFTAALADRARAGASVHVQAAPPFSSDDDGNRPALDALAAAGADATEFGGPLWLHNKGVVVDERLVYVGSMNQNHHSRSNNRELGVLVDDARVAAYFENVAESDAAHAAVAPRDWDAVADDLESLPGAPWPILFGALLLLGVLRR